MKPTVSSVAAKGVGLVGERRPVLVSSKEPEVAAAARVVEAFTRVSPRLAVSGGSALKALGSLRRQLRAEKFRQLRLCWADERCVPFLAPQSNRGSAFRDGALSLAEPPADELTLYLDGETQDQACRRVTETFKARFQNAIDVALLGMGEDGHVASLFPGRPELQSTATVIGISDSPKPPAERITLSLASLMTAHTTVIFAVGTEKRRAIGRLMEQDPTLPASRFKQVIVVTDQVF